MLHVGDGYACERRVEDYNRFMHENENNPESLPHPQVERDHNIEAEEFVTYVFERAQQQKSLFFETEEAATAEYTSFIVEANERLIEIGRLNDVLFEISGPGINVPVLSMSAPEMDGSSSALVLSLDHDEPEPLDMFESIYARFHSVVSFTEEDEEKGGFTVTTQIVMTSAQPQTVAMNSPHFKAPVASVLVYPTYMVECSDASTIEIPELVEKRASEHIALELAKNGLSASTFGRTLSELRTVFEHENLREYTEFPNVQLLRDLGRISNERARQTTTDSELMSRAVLDVVGKGRRLEITGIPVGHEEAVTDIIETGRVVDVLMPASMTDEISPMLVIEVQERDEGETVIYRYPFDRIYSIRF